MSELIFEKDYELLQEITYGYKGNSRTTKKVILKAPTFKQSDKLEAALRQLDPISAIINFICDAELLVTKDDQTPIPSALLNELHVKAYRALANDYAKFFLASESLEAELK